MKNKRKNVQNVSVAVSSTSNGKELRSSLKKKSNNEENKHKSTSDQLELHLVNNSSYIDYNQINYTQNRSAYESDIEHEKITTI